MVGISSIIIFGKTQFPRIIKFKISFKWIYWIIVFLKIIIIDNKSRNNKEEKKERKRKKKQRKWKRKSFVTVGKTLFVPFPSFNLLSLLSFSLDLDLIPIPLSLSLIPCLFPFFNIIIYHYCPDDYRILKKWTNKRKKKEKNKIKGRSNK